MSQPIALQDVKTDMVLTGLIIDYGDQSFIADILFPVMTVKHDSDKYYLWKRKGFNTKGLDTRRDDRARAKMIDVGVTNDTYQVVQHALASFIEDSLLNNADSILNIRERTAENIVDHLDMVKEQEAAALVFATATYGASNQISLDATNKWSALTNAASDPQEDVSNAKLQVLKVAGVIPNTLVMGIEGYEMLKRHTLVREAVKFVMATLDSNMTQAIIANWLGVEKIVLGTATANSANEGQTAAEIFVWATHAALLYIAGSSAINRPTFGMQFRPGHTPRTVERWREPGTKGEYMEVNEKRVLKVVFPNAGYFFQNAFA